MCYPILTHILFVSRLDYLCHPIFTYMLFVSTPKCLFPSPKITKS